ncbi:MAG: heparinase II/III family protein [Chitinophagaceae bacterium]
MNDGSLILGADNYNIPGYFDTGIKGQRWTYYRTRAEGHNTLVIAPGLLSDQDTRADTRMTGFGSHEDAAFTTMDLTPAYAAHANTVKRGIALAEKREVVIVNDVISNSQPADVYWFAHTRASISLSTDKKTATLTQHGKKYLATIVSPANAVFDALPAAPLPSSPQPKENNANKGIQKLNIHLAAVDTTNIVVVFHKEKTKAKSAYTKGLETWK